MLYIRAHTKEVRLYVLNVEYLDNRKWKYGQQEVKIWTVSESMDNTKWKYGRKVKVWTGSENGDNRK